MLLQTGKVKPRKVRGLGPRKPHHADQGPLRYAASDPLRSSCIREPRLFQGAEGHGVMDREGPGGGPGEDAKKQLEGKEFAQKVSPGGSQPVGLGVGKSPWGGPGGRPRQQPAGSQGAPDTTAAPGKTGLRTRQQAWHWHQRAGSVPQKPGPLPGHMG